MQAGLEAVHDYVNGNGTRAISPLWGGRFR